MSPPAVFVVVPPASPRAPPVSSSPHTAVALTTPAHPSPSAVSSPRTAAAPLWAWKRAGAAAAAAAGDAAAAAAPLVVPGGLFSSSPRRGPSRDALDARAEHASAKKARLLTATSNTLKGIDAGRRARARGARMRRLSGTAAARHALRKTLAGADARRAALMAAKLAAVHSHLEAVQVKRAVVMAARAAAKVSQTATAC